MGKGLWERAWVRHVAVAVAYGVAVVLFRGVSVTQWMILAGLRLSVLLLTPYRYWPALVAGESAYFIYMGYVCSATWGGVWGVMCAVPAIVYVAPVVYWIRRQWPPLGKNAIKMGRLLSCALLASVIVTIDDVGLVLVTKHLPTGYVVDYAKLASNYLIGNYLGILTVTPTLLLIYQLGIRKSWRKWLAGASNSRLLFETTFLAVPSLLFLIWIGLHAHPHAETREMAQVAMFLPVVWLALRHGWQGAALGGTAASCAVMVLMPELRDPITIQAEAVISFAISTMLLMGARIAVLDGRAVQERINMSTALALAQRNIYVGEMQLRMTSQALEQLREVVQSGYSMMMGRLRHLQPAVDDRGYRRYALTADAQIQRLADNLYPISLREKGLPSALRAGSLAQILEEAGLPYSCDLQGALSRLSLTLRMTIYRIVMEAVADACLKKNISAVEVRIRSGEARGRLGVMVSVRFRVNAIDIEHIHWEELIPEIVRATSGLGLRSVKDRAAIFEGRMNTRGLHDGWRVSVILLDPCLPSDV